MSRSVGLSVFSSNFEPRTASPLDSRMLVDTLADLHEPATWQSGDGSYYAYKGMLVCVCNDTEENNGVYRLAALPYTTSSNWVKLGSGTGTGFTWYPDDTPPDVPEIGDAYYDTALGKSRVWSDGAWQTVANDGNDGAQGLPGEDGTNGITPHIDAGGNWFIGETDTGILAIGQDGEDGNDGTNGITPHIDETTGNWFIGETDTGIPAQGPAGEDGQDGINGTNGVTPHIGVNGNWFIGETDTGIPATGPAGTDGNDGAQGLPGDTVPLSDSSPAALGSATAGVSTSAARGDHVHPTTGLVLASEKGAVNGIASLGADGKVPASQLPEMSGILSGKIEAVAALPAPVVGILNRAYFLTAADGEKAKGTTWKCVADGESYIFQQIQTDLASLTDTTGILAGKVGNVTGKALSTNDYTNDDKTAVGKIELETLTELTGADVTVAPWTQSKWSASGTCTLTATGWAESGRQTAYIIITLAAGSTLSVVDTEAVEDGDALSAAGVYECFLKNVDGKIYFRQISFTEVVA